MPVNRGTLVGVDLVAIKPIPHVTTFAEDITTQKCRNEIKKAMNNEKADVVLHDGAPNVGTEWHQDAFSQAELALAATKLATEFLAPGGWFVTKVFRSGEYNKLLWVLYQLFGKVVATKPQASRSVSAEIFVVCQGFLAPKKIDPKLLDPKFVFKDIDQSLQQQNIFDADPKKHKRHRMGYEDGATVLYKEATVDDYVKNHDPITVLGALNALTFKDERSKRYEKHEATTAEVKACIADLKVLNKKDFKLLLKWRAALREAFGDELKAEKAEARALAGSDASEATDDSDEDGEGALVEIDESIPKTPEEEEALRQTEVRHAFQSFFVFFLVFLEERMIPIIA
jgi:AdoMet-dependent rRNA methyltransferase SPB1